MNLIDKLLRKNISAGRIAGFVLSNFIGLVIIMVGLQFFFDARSIYDSDDSFIRKDYMVINKHITSDNSLNSKSSTFTDAEIADLEKQPWVRKVGRFEANDYRVYASVKSGSRALSTSMFFEAIPSEFIDVAKSQWHYKPGDNTVPIIISKDYLALYNFGFAGSAGMPQLSESIMSGIPLELRISSDSANKTVDMNGYIVGFSNRLNTILVPADFMEWSNQEFGNGRKLQPSRLIIDVSSPGDVAINQYLDSHGLEVAGDKSSSQAAFLVKIITGIIIGIGGLITIMSLFILMLSMSLLLEKNRDKLHTILMLGCDLGKVAAPYCRLIIVACIVAWILSAITMLAIRATYITPLVEIGADPQGIWQAAAIGLAVTGVVTGFNIMSVKRKIKQSWLR